MRIVRDIKVAQRGGKEETQKEGEVIPTPFGAHVEKPNIRQKADTSKNLIR
jgi:hypothetical protein